jgi:CBS domain-containing protein
MSPQTINDAIRRESPLLRDTTTVVDAVRQILDCDLPALPVVDADDRYVGIFGEREFMGAFFPGYLDTLKFAGFVSKNLEDVLERRSQCTSEPVAKHMNTEHVDVPVDASDVQLAETFLHHRVLLIPVTADRHVVGVITRREFFRALAERAIA